MSRNPLSTPEFDVEPSRAGVGAVAGAVGATVAFSTVSGVLAVTGVTAVVTFVCTVALALAFDVDLA